MKKYLLPEKGTFYKANLHTHTTVTDGKFSPEEIKEIYKAHGYSIVAYTDHDMFVPHHELTDDSFLALSGFEVGINEKNSYPGIPGGRHRTCHICCIAKSKDETIQPCWNPKYAYIGNAKQNHHLIKYDESKPFYERDYSSKGINDMIYNFRNEGFFVTYNHPTWSLEKYNDYMGYNGMHAMEIYNYGSDVLGYPAYVPTIYDDMLMGGKKIYAISADDCHSMNEACGGYIMVKAEKLEYEIITDAIFSGNFYASTGPEIYDLYIEDGKLHISCSDAITIRLNTGRRRAGNVTAPMGEFLNSAVFDVNENDRYMRVTVLDAHGKFAETNAYFNEDIMEV